MIMISSPARKKMRKRRNLPRTKPWSKKRANRSLRKTLHLNLKLYVNVVNHNVKLQRIVMKN